MVVRFQLIIGLKVGDKKNICDVVVPLYK